MKSVLANAEVKCMRALAPPAPAGRGGCTALSLFPTWETAQFLNIDSNKLKMCSINTEATAEREREQGDKMESE